MKEDSVREKPDSPVPQSQVPPTTCLDEDVVVAYVSRALAAQERERVDAHLASCAECRRLVFDVVQLEATASADAPADTAPPAKAPLEATRFGGTGGRSHDGPARRRSPAANSLAPARPAVGPGASSGPGPSSPRARRDAVLAAGTTVGGFKVLRLLGVGGMGHVYLARDMQLGRKVALKLIHPDLVGTREALDRFVFEARTTARFAHPNIVTLFAAGELDGSPYMALEYVEGETLRQRMQAGPVARREAMRIALAIAEALEEAHRHGVLHRDLTPNNVLIGKDGRLRVVDFGLSTVRERTEATRLTDSIIVEPTGSSPAVAGTPSYMAPEQWRAERATPRTDVWALGTILFELLAGRRPYDVAPPARPRTIDELAAAVSDPAPAPGVRSCADVSDKLARLVDGCLTKAPAERPDVTTVARTLRHLLERERTTDGRSPFRGLLPFGEAHAGVYFGRTPEVAEFVERLRAEPVAALVGPSGVGKTSFVEAGVIPRLRELGTWTVVRFRPGTKPLATLAARLLSASGKAAGPEPSALLAAELASSPTALGLHLQALAATNKGSVLLFVDQLEEAYTLTSDETERRSLLRAVFAAADEPSDPVRVIVGLRDDVLGKVASDVPEAQLALGRLVVLRAMREQGLREVLERTAEAVGYHYESASLVADILAGVQGERASLPLLQVTAQVLWEKRDTDGKVLLRAAYDAIGGVSGALTHHADSVLAGLSPEETSTARELLLRLVSPERARKVVPRAALLEGLGAHAPALLVRLTTARLVSVRKGEGAEAAEIELAHEALVTAWQTLARWLDASREEHLLREQLEDAAALWLRRGASADETWTGASLADARALLARHAMRPSERAERFLAAGTARQQREHRRGRLQQAPIALAVIVATAAAIALLRAGRGEGRDARGSNVLTTSAPCPPCPACASPTR